MALPLDDRSVADRHERFLAAARPELDRLYRLAGLILADAVAIRDLVTILDAGPLPVPIREVSAEP